MVDRKSESELKVVSFFLALLLLAVYSKSLAIIQVIQIPLLSVLARSRVHPQENVDLIGSFIPSHTEVLVAYRRNLLVLDSNVQRFKPHDRHLQLVESG